MFRYVLINPKVVSSNLTAATKEAAFADLSRRSVSKAGLELLSRHRVGGSVIVVVQQPSAPQPSACRPSDVG